MQQAVATISVLPRRHPSRELSEIDPVLRIESVGFHIKFGQRVIVTGTLKMYLLVIVVTCRSRLMKRVQISLNLTS